jgi:3'-5' exoribonuclease 1
MLNATQLENQFMNYIIYDLEATCWDQHDRQDNETIEIGAVLINEKCEIISHFEEFVKPIRNPVLSEFCKNLTTIKQTEIDNAKHFYEVIEAFKSWIDYSSNDYWLCSWGFYDKKQFKSDCLIHNLETDWLNRHISLKHQHYKIKNLRRAMGMKKAMELDDLELEGTHHRGIDDAKNIAKIFIKYFDQWEFK